LQFQLDTGQSVSYKYGTSGQPPYHNDSSFGTGLSVRGLHPRISLKNLLTYLLTYISVDFWMARLCPWHTSGNFGYLVKYTL